MWKIKHNSLPLVNCATTSNGNYEFCNCTTCSENEGDCDSHDECQDGLGCASCPANLGFGSNTHCCTQRGVDNVDWFFRTNSDPCGIDEGHCSNDGECKDWLLCATNNFPASFGFPWHLDCCIS